MSDTFSADKLQPYLLDRLIDEQPESRRESRVARVMTPSELRSAVLRDLRWLLNANAHPPEDFADFGEVSRSVLNYGSPDLCGRMISGLNIDKLERDLAAAIRNFEPRILPDALKIKVKVDATVGTPNTIALEIRGEMWATPYPEELYIKTEIDLETGVCKL